MEDETRTFDLLRNIDQFSIIQKLMRLFLVMWFKKWDDLDDDEDIDLCVLEQEKVLEMIKNGQICDAKTIVCILKFFNMR